jgi:uncharacterized protein with HEPN domain
MVNNDIDILKKVLTEINFLTELVNGIQSPEEFTKSEFIKRAVGMTLINIGEFSKGLTLDFRQSHRQIPARHMSDLRNIAAHSYYCLRFDDVYKTATEVFPKVKLEIEKAIVEILNKHEAAVERV